MTLSTLADELSAEQVGGDARFNSVSTDSRVLSPGQLYVALVGENFDGNDFIGQAVDKGAAAAVVSDSADHDLPLLRVKDSTLALGQIGHINRKKSQAKVIALTGSQGKTTVKEMLGQILATCGNPLVTTGNLNNAIGVPLTLLELNQHHDFAVVEMGANALGEIAYSVALVEPDIGLITNAGSAHLEGFGGYHGIVSGKGEIIDGVKAEGTVVLNKNDKAFDCWRERAATKRVVSFAIFDDGNETVNRSDIQADYFASQLLIGNRGLLSFELRYPTGTKQISLKLLGKHNVANAVAAAAVAMEAGASAENVVEGLQQLVPVQGRMCALPGPNNSQLIDDSYNASPTSVKAAIDVLADFSGTRILVVGDMKELGEATTQAHKEVGEYASEKKINAVWSVGQMSELTSSAAAGVGRHFANQQELIKSCLRAADAETVFLIKGSRSARMDAVVDGLIRGEAV